MAANLLEWRGAAGGVTTSVGAPRGRREAGWSLRGDASVQPPSGAEGCRQRRRMTQPHQAGVCVGRWLHESGADYIERAADDYLRLTKAGADLDSVLVISPTWAENHRLTD